MRKQRVVSNRIDLEIRIGEPLKVSEEGFGSPPVSDCLLAEPDSTEETFFFADP
jgi:hypothetical protein